MENLWKFESDFLQIDASTSLNMTTQHKVGVSVSKRYFKKQFIEIESKDFCASL